MPLVKIELCEGNSPEFCSELMCKTMDCVQRNLKLPSNDRNIRLAQYKQEFFTTKPPYKYIIEITLFAGRSHDVKRQLYRDLVDTLNKGLSIAPEEVFIVLNEQPMENWGIRGGQSGADVTLGFKIDV